MVIYTVLDQAEREIGNAYEEGGVRFAILG